MATSSDRPMLDRPFYFVIAVWGERFRNYFLDLCLPTLLSPGNLPALATAQRSKFLIWTRPDDWAAMKTSPIFRLLEQYIDPVFNELPPCPVDTSPCIHMGIGHRRGLEMAYAAKAYPFVITPDCMLSDGMVARLQQLAIEGIELALVPALRFAEEPFFDRLHNLGVSPRDRNGVAEPISLSSRQLVHMALASMHSETMAYEWDAPYFTPTPSAAWWRVPGEDGIVVHSLSWATPLLDFAAVPTHDTSTFDQWTLDGDYVYKNIGNIKKVHLVLDSDEMFIASWARRAEKPLPLTPQPALQRKPTGDLTRKERFRDWFYSGVFDRFKQETFFQPARWHARPTNENWRPVEKHALATLLSCVAPPGSQYSELRNRLSCGDSAAAITLLDDMLANDHGNAHFLSLRAEAYTALGQDDQAEADLTEALQLPPGDEPLKATRDSLLVKRAAIRMKRKNVVEAIVDYEAAAGIAPDKEILTSLADARLAAGDAKNALADYEHTLALGQPTPAQYFRIWQARSMLGDYSGAAAAASKAVELDPKNADLYYCLGSSYFSLKRYDEVLEELSKALAINPEMEHAIFLRAAATVVRSTPIHNWLRDIWSQRIAIYYLLGRALTRRASMVSSLWAGRSNIGHRLAQMLQGDRIAWSRATWRFRQFVYQMSGLEFKEREPS